MSLSEADREVLLAEIQQIKFTLEAAGNHVSLSSDEEDDGGGDVKFDVAMPGRKRDKKSSARDVFSVEGSVADSNECSAESILSAAERILTDSRPPVEGWEGVAGNSMSASGASTPSLHSDGGSFLTSIPSSLGDGYVQVVPKLNVPTTTKKKGRKKTNKSSLIIEATHNAAAQAVSSAKSLTGSLGTSLLSYPVATSGGDSEDDFSALDISIPPSLATPPGSQVQEQIKMTNMYVERIFRSFRDKKLPGDVSGNAGGVPKHMSHVLDKINLRSSASVSTLENMLQANRRYQEVVQDELQKVALALQRNRRSQDELAAESLERDDASSERQTFLSKAAIGRFANPYYKDGEGLGPPENADTKEKKGTNCVTNFEKRTRLWTRQERESLREGVANNNLEKKLEPVLQQLRKVDKDARALHQKPDRETRTRISEKIAEIKEIPNEDLMADSSDIDFFKISKNYLPERDEFECRLQWCNLDHPNINHAKFTKDEDSKLFSLAKKYKNHNWQLIARELNTKRTPVQCLQRFQRSLNKDMLKVNWNATEDAQLLEAVSIHGEQDWVSVADHMTDRTSMQCMHRWTKTVNPNIRRGKWGEDEDKLLVDAVMTHGIPNWKKVREEVPGRTDAQCRERYMSCLNPGINWQPFTKDEDEVLMTLIMQHGPGKWSTIAKHFPNRSDNQIWRRYKQLNFADYHEYRKQVMWKKNSVLNYFTRRKKEKLDYAIKDLDVDLSPTINCEETKNLEAAHKRLLESGIPEEEVAAELARMHFSGELATEHVRAKSTVDQMKKKKKLHAEGKEHMKRGAAKKNAEAAEAATEIAEAAEVQETRKLQVKAKILGNLADDTILDKSTNVLLAYETEDLSYEEARDKLDIFYWVIQQEKSEHERLSLSEKVCAMITRLEETHVKALEAQVDWGEISAGQSPLASPLTSPDGLGTSVDGRQLGTRERMQLKQEERFSCASPLLYVDSAPNTPLQSPLMSPVGGSPAFPHSSEGFPSSVVQDSGSKKRKNLVPRKVMAVKAEQLDTPSGFDFTVEPQDSNANRGALDEDSPEVEDSPEIAVSSSNENAQHLKAFTLLLQALHIDTMGVMHSLPAAATGTMPPTGTPSTLIAEHRPFPVCYPLAPNTATLHGFRAMLVQRRTLKQTVDAKYRPGPSMSKSTRNLAYKNTRAYQALQSRFQSLFLWPAFLATFVPKFSLPEPDRTKCAMPLPPRRPGPKPTRKTVVSVTPVSMAPVARSTVATAKAGITEAKLDVKPVVVKRGPGRPPKQTSHSAPSSAQVSPTGPTRKRKIDEPLSISINAVSSNSAQSAGATYKVKKRSSSANVSPAGPKARQRKSSPRNPEFRSPTRGSESARYSLRSPTTSVSPKT